MCTTKWLKTTSRLHHSTSIHSIHTTSNIILPQRDYTINIIFGSRSPAIIKIDINCDRRALGSNPSTKVLTWTGDSGLRPIKWPSGRDELMMAPLHAEPLNMLEYTF